MLCMYVYGCCVVFYDCPVGEIHVVIQEEEEDGHRRLKLTKGSVCKASIAWDYPRYLFTFKHLIHIACVYLVCQIGYPRYLITCTLNTFGIMHCIVFASA